MKPGWAWVLGLEARGQGLWLGPEPSPRASVAGGPRVKDLLLLGLSCPFCERGEEKEEDGESPSQAVDASPEIHRTPHGWPEEAEEGASGPQREEGLAGAPGAGSGKSRTAPPPPALGRGQRVGGWQDVLLPGASIANEVPSAETIITPSVE